MKKYTINEVKNLELKLGDCLYSLNRRTLLEFRLETAVSKTDEFLFRYYMEKFLHEISELYTYFYNEKDEIILNQFHASEEEREKLREYRNPIAHVDGNVDKTLKRLDDYFSVWDTTNLRRDLVLMIEHSLKVAAGVGLEERFVKHLEIVQGMFPQDMFK